MLEALHRIIAEGNLWAYLSIPLISGLVGWSTNVLALKMTFYPLKFIGVGPLGWQGIIPAKAGSMAGKAVDLMTKNLISIEDRFDQIEPERVAEEMEPALNRLAVQVIDEVMEDQAPALWESMPPPIRQRIYQRVSDDLPEVVEDVMQDVKNHITELFDLRGMVVNELEKDKQLLNEVFLKVGDMEFRFIERSGFYFGGLFGLVQMFLFFFANEVLGYDQQAAGWTLPAAGLVVGWATNDLALRMIFEPLRPRQIGPWRIQGLFIRRQMEVADAYANIVANQILTVHKIFETMVTGPTADRLGGLIQAHIKRSVDSTVGMGKAAVQAAYGSRTYVRIKRAISQRFVDELPHYVKHMFRYAEEALDIESTLRSRMQGLDALDFVSFLRPVFQEDEWKLILVGAVLGFFAGLAQMVFIFGPDVVAQAEQGVSMIMP
jgi:uncharacterized membrane protein YheB (UPF0754 family)